MNTISHMYVGTWPRAYRTDPADIAFGVYSLNLDQASGELSPAGMAMARWPGWVSPHPSEPFVYAVSEVADYGGGSGGSVSAFVADRATGALTPLNEQPTGPAPAHCAVDATGHFLLVASYAGGTVHMFPIEADGRLGSAVDIHQHVGSSVHPQRQDRPRPHSVNLDPANRWVLVPDLGTDSIVVYELDRADARMVPHPGLTIQVAPGSGPRHMAFHPRAGYAYLINEISATVTAYAYAAGSGRLREIQTVPALPEGFSGFRSGAEIAVDPAGRFLYASTRSRGSKSEPPERGLDSIVWFEIDATSGRLTPLGRVHSGGEVPRSFLIDPRGELLFVAHQGSSTIVTFRLDGTSGEPVPTGQVYSTPAPVCLQLAPAYAGTL